MNGGSRTDRDFVERGKWEIVKNVAPSWRRPAWGAYVRAA
jgi:hypothetical protein